MQAAHGLCPDLVFFTGDAAFGQLGKERGKAIADQFREAHDFLTAVRQAFEPELRQRDLFLVPGNHDVNREQIAKYETSWLAEAHSLEEIETTAHQAGTDWQRLLARLDDYARFLDAYGYDHLLTGRDHLIYADAREVAGLRVGIAGFNSAWSSRGAGRDELGRLWMAGRFQSETLVQQMPAHDFTIALVHHPGNWLVPEENPHVGRLWERDFAFLLHGHEHQGWVRPDASNGHTTISAGACHEWSESKDNGYNFVRLNLDSGTGEVWLRRYDSKGAGWVPRCIDRLEFRELGFVAAHVEPMTAQDRDTFIDRWHESLEVRLRNWGEPADLRPLARRLKIRLEETPTIARLTVNPLLCAAVCALHRQRHENLPETPVELCEKLCEMLLHRRDLERPGLTRGRNFDPSYNKLDFRVRKGLLSKLAHHMINTGVSAIEESVADQQIAEALQSYQLSDVDAVVIRRALVERSGMLQESSGRRIELLHNTLKEFLAAERFANGGEVEILAGHADDPSWQPVILFAVALPRDGSRFATELVRAILKRTPLQAPAKGRSREARQQAADIRRRQFFFFRCCTNAYQLNDDEITAAFKKLSTDLLPPQNMTDAEALAACGDTLVPYLARHEDWTAAQRAACVRTLGLIGGPRAKRCLESYATESTVAVREELGRAVRNPFEFPGTVAHLEEHGCFPAWISGRSLSELRNMQIKATSGQRGGILSDLAGFFQHAATRAIEDEIPVRDRNLLALALGWLGDPRVTVDLRVTTHPDDNPGYLKIPAGQYYFGDPKKRITIKKPFWLSKYPVTNSQFALFMDDSGYGRRKFWSGEGWRWKSWITQSAAYWSDPDFNAPNQPVVGVSWWEAEAFCRWAGGFLPTEQQWEAAARGPKGYKYPWGNDWEDGICNSHDTKLGGPSAVGIFPRGRSVFGWRTWPATCGNGAVIVSEAHSGWTGAAAGGTTRSSAGRRAVAGAIRRSRTTTWASASRGQFPVERVRFRVSGAWSGG